MKQIVSLVILAILLGFFVPPTFAQGDEENCNEELLNNLELHQLAMYIFAEPERPTFARRDFVVAIIVYSNKLVIEEDACGLSVQAALLSWAFEIYRIKGNIATLNQGSEIFDAELAANTKALDALFKQRDAVLYINYCNTYPIACTNGKPMSYEDLVQAVEAPIGSLIR